MKISRVGSNTDSEIIRSMLEKLGIKIEITPDEDKECPGGKIRSRGLGKGLGRGLGKGPRRGLEIKDQDELEDDLVLDEENKECPGSKIRSKGKGKGLGYGRGKGPIGIPIKNKD